MTQQRIQTICLQHRMSEADLAEACGVPDFECPTPTIERLLVLFEQNPLLVLQHTKQSLYGLGGRLSFLDKGAYERFETLILSTVKAGATSVSQIVARFADLTGGFGQSNARAVILSLTEEGAIHLSQDGSVRLRNQLSAPKTRLPPSPGYQSQQLHWKRLYDETPCDKTGWTTPWLDDSLYDGNPMFSAWNAYKRVGLRVIVYDTDALGRCGGTPRVTHWLNTFAKDTPDAVEELVISCAGIPEHYEEVRRLITGWIHYRRVPREV